MALATSDDIQKHLKTGLFSIKSSQFAAFILAEKSKISINRILYVARTVRLQSGYIESLTVCYANATLTIPDLELYEALRSWLDVLWTSFGSEGLLWEH